MNNSKLTAEEIQQSVNREYDDVVYVYENNINDRKEIEEHLMTKGYSEEDAAIIVGQILERADALKRKDNKNIRYVNRVLLVVCVAGVVYGIDICWYLSIFFLWDFLQSFFKKKRWITLVIAILLMMGLKCIMLLFFFYTANK